MKITSLSLLFLFVSFFLFSQEKEESSFSASIEYHIQNQFDTLKLPALNWVLEEGQQILTAEDLFAGRQKDAAFINLKESPVFAQKAHRAYWFNLQLSTAVNTDLFGIAFYRNGNCWPFDPSFKEVEAYSMNGDGEITRGFSGTASPHSKRDFPEILLPSLIRGNIQEKESLNLWVKIVMAEGCNLQVDLELISKDFLQMPRPLTVQLGGHNLLRGATLILFFIALLLFLWSGELVYLWFVFFQVSLLTYGLNRDYPNEIFNLLFAENPRAFIFCLGFFSLLVFISLLQFGRVFINTKTHFPRIHSILGYGMLSLVLMTIIGTTLRFVSYIPGDFFFLSRQILMGLTMAGIFFCLIYLLSSKNRLARFYSIGTLFPFAAILFRLSEMNVLHSTYPRDVSLIVSSGMVLTFTLALAYRFRMLMIEKEAEMEEALRIKEESRRLSEIEKLKSNFFSNITHEFRTPLTLILEPVRQLLKKDNDPDSRQKLTLVKNNSEKLLGLINQLLDMSKIEGGKMQLDLRWGKLFEVIQPIYQSFLLLADRKGIRLKMKADKDIAPFYFDKGKVEKIVYNLLSNAIKFTEEGQVELLLTKRDNSFIIHVKDSGIGIPKDQLPHIFDRFHQVDASHTRQGEGTGIGLALVKELVNLMDGTIAVKSEMSIDTSFEVAIPMIFKAKEKTPKAAIPEPINADSNISENGIIKTKEVFAILPETEGLEKEDRPLILLVEDHAELRTFIKQSLKTDYKIIEASNGAKGIDCAKEFVPDLIISDLMMPEKDGFELTQELKNDELTSHIPIILLTAKSALDSKIQGFETGADAYLTKPFNTEELLVRIRNLIESRKLLQQKYLGGNQLKDSESMPGFSKIDNGFIKKITLEIYEGMADPKFSVAFLADKIFMSRSQLFRKTKALTGLTAVQFIRNIRLDRAKELLQNKEGNVNEVSMTVGFNDDRYFSTKFKERFGLLPSEV